MADLRFVTQAAELPLAQPAEYNIPATVAAPRTALRCPRPARARWQRSALSHYKNDSSLCTPGKG